MEADAKRLSMQLVQKVAAHKESDPLELPPLYDYIDPDALGAQIEKITEGSISFEYTGVRVTVDSTGDIQIEQSCSTGREIDITKN